MDNMNVVPILDRFGQFIGEGAILIDKNLDYVAQIPFFLKDLFLNSRIGLYQVFKATADRMTRDLNGVQSSCKGLKMWQKMDLYPHFTSLFMH